VGVRVFEERGGAVGIVAVGSSSVASIVVAEARCDRELVAKSGIIVNKVPLINSRKETHGGMRVMSVLEPDPGLVGLTKVVSIIVQPSPLKPQLPTWR